MASSNESHAISGFQDIDGLTVEQMFLVRFLDLLDTFEAIRAYRSFTIDLLKSAQVRSCLDVGSGTGTFANELAAALGTDADVTGIDISETMVAIGQQRSADRQLDVTFAVADAEQLPFDDDHFDAARSERVFMYLSDPEKAASELMRVTRPGGCVIVSDADLGTGFWSVPGVDKTATQRVLSAVIGTAPHGLIGSELRSIIQRVGAEDVQVRADVVMITDATVALDGMGNRQFIEQLGTRGVLTEDEVAKVIAGSEAAGESGDYFTGFTYFTVTGRVPSSPGR